MSIFMRLQPAVDGGRSGPRFPENRHRERYRRALAGGAADLEIPPEQHSTLAHAHETEPIGPAQLRLPHALAIVLDLQRDPLLTHLEIDADAGRLGVARDV